MKTHKYALCQTIVLGDVADFA